MKKAIIALSLGLIYLSSCKEKAPLINFGHLVPLVDTTYVTDTVPAADAHNVLIEDFTGASCSNCPSAAAVIKSLEDANPNRINTMSLYIHNFPQTEPPAGAAYDFRSGAADSIDQLTYGAIFAEPCGGIDRMPWGTGLGSAYQIQYSDWTSDVNTRLAVQDSINLRVTSQLDTINNWYVITATVTYLYPTTIKHSLSIAIVEDGMIDKQEDGTTVDDNYHFDHVLRSSVLGASGQAILPSMDTKERGRVTVNAFKFTPRPDTKPANCRVIAYVHDNGNSSTHVYQSWQCKL